METVTSFRISVEPVTQPLPVTIPDDVLSLEPCSDLEFVLGLAYRCLEHEADAATSRQAKQQVAYLLDRLCDLDFRD